MYAPGHKMGIIRDTQQHTRRARWQLAGGTRFFIQVADRFYIALSVQ
jgi:hypothetical protein